MFTGCNDCLQVVMDRLQVVMDCVQVVMDCVQVCMLGATLLVISVT